MADYYVLDADNVATPVDDLLVWAKWFEGNTERRIVKQENVGPYWISTVFLGLDHNWFKGPPLIFETMVFSDKALNHAGDQQRCSTWKEAENMHRRMVELVSDSESHPEPDVVPAS